MSILWLSWRLFLAATALVGVQGLAIDVDAGGAGVVAGVVGGAGTLKYGVPGAILDQTSGGELKHRRIPVTVIMLSQKLTL